jgi:hypothetical protein
MAVHGAAPYKSLFLCFLGDSVSADVTGAYYCSMTSQIALKLSQSATVDKEGLTNNYGVEPEMYYAAFPFPQQARQYAIQGFAAATLVVGLIPTSLVIR